MKTAKKLFKNKNLPPGPIGLPIIGNLLTIGDRPHDSLANLAKIYGPLMTVKLGSVNIVVASSTEMAKEILQKNDQNFLGRPIPDAVTAEKGYELSMAWLSGGLQWKKTSKNLPKSDFHYAKIGFIARFEASDDEKHGCKSRRSPGNSRSHSCREVGVRCTERVESADSKNNGACREA
ncbi:geraniol 8-hydroxylase-like [Forsythia ovata]|uniref:Geraniol 8-hydroxylase-like n=1 Tax=Forsythia ovata TaxID=205694 RepID=A0ABD1W248_9LAMI